MTMSISELHQIYDGPLPDRLRDEAMGNASTTREQAIRDLTLLMQDTAAAIERLQEQYQWYKAHLDLMSGGSAGGNLPRVPVR